MSKKIIIVSEKYKYLFNNCEFLSQYQIITIPDNPNVDSRLSGHTDLSVFKISEKLLILKDYLKGSTAEKQISEAGIEIIFDNSIQSEKYPCDCGLNAALLGNSIICCKKATSETVINECLKSGYMSIYVNQGYIKCSVCPINSVAAITSDPGIYKTLAERSFDVLLINPNNIILKGYNHGFFGGCAFMLNSNILCLTGIINDSSIKSQINDFSAKHGIKVRYLSREILSDIGSCVVIN